MKIETYTISEKNAAFVWLPPKCATNLISWILAYFEFSSIAIDTETNQIHKITPNQSTHFGHNTILPPNHQELSFICAVRNPYYRVLSFYQSHSKDSSESNFEKFINDKIINNKQYSFFGFSKFFGNRNPNYLIRTENLYEDLIKIPFIKNSDLNESGILKKFSERKMNESSNRLNPEEYLTPRIKEIIYELSSDHFELFGYEK